MYLIELDQIPNQTFSVMLDNINYRVALRTIQGLTYISVWANGDILFYNQLCTPNAFVNPFKYVGMGGKFYFKSTTGDYPNYKDFGINQTLYYLTKEEVADA